MIKPIYAYLILAVALTSCSQQRFAFRKTIKVDEKVELVKKQTKSTEQPLFTDVSVAAESQPQQAPVSAESVQIETQTQNSGVLAEASVETGKPMTMEPEWRPKKSETPTSPKDSQKAHGEGSGNGLAIAGFVSSIVGLFVFPILFSTVAIVFGAIGLKSERRGLAIASLVIGIVGLVAGIVILAMA